MNFQASNQGIEIIDAARRNLGWSKTEGEWLNQAKVSEGTLKRFWKPQPIRADNFKAICAAVGVNDWQSIVDWRVIKPSQMPISPTIPYINRPPIEQRCYQEITRPGALIRVKAPQGMGKTYLINQIFNYAIVQGYQTVPLNLFQADYVTLNSLDRLLLWFCSSISRRLHLKNQISTVWEDASSSNDNCTAYFESCILNQLQTPLIIGLDNVDRVFNCPTVAADFFGLLRSWYEDARLLDDWKQLRVIISHSTEAYVTLNANQSPFNVGLPIELSEFTSTQVMALAHQYSINWSPDEIDKLMAMIGGHPALVNQAFEAISTQEGLTLEQFLTLASTSASPYRNHLNKLKDSLQAQDSLQKTLKTIVNSPSPIPVDCDQGFKLFSMGIIKWYRDKAEPRCQLYRQYFQHCYK